MSPYSSFLTQGGSSFRPRITILKSLFPNATTFILKGLQAIIYNHNLFMILGIIFDQSFLLNLMRKTSGQ